MLRTLVRGVASRLKFASQSDVLPTAYQATGLFGTRCMSQSTIGQEVPSKAQVVICGGGVIGVSVAYHLAELGWNDVVVLEQGSIGCGTSWHAAGLIGKLKSSPSAALVDYSAKLYAELEEQGFETGWKQCGSLNLARTPDRIIAYKRIALNAQKTNIETHILSPEECQEKCPVISLEGLEGGVWIPGDGVASPMDVVNALVKKTKPHGVKFLENRKVTRVMTHQNKVVGVETDSGSIECQYFVNAAGQWARQLGQLSEPHVRVPLHSCEHYYLVTKPMQGIDFMMPVVRDYDGHIYLREWSGGLLAGGFEPRAKPVFDDGIPDRFEFQLLPEDWDHFQILLEEMLHRVPGLHTAEVRQLLNGPESFTPDGRPIVGESPEIANYFVAAGMNSAGISLAGGVGKHLADWIVKGLPSMDLWSFDIRRFVDMHNNKKFLKDRVSETLGIHSVVNPVTAYKTGRGLRTSPLHTHLKDDGASFIQTSMGFERPGFFLTNDQIFDGFSEMESSSSVSFGKPPWFENVRSEYWACREGVCLIDMSTFAKFELRSAGTEVVKFLQYMCSNDIDRPTGMVIHTGMQNEWGGYENDCSVVRLADNHYFMISPTAQQTRSFAWLKHHLPIDGSVQLNDVTSMYTAINIIGPRAQDLLSELTDTQLGKQEFYSMTCKEIDVGQASGVKAMRLTHSGEDGWMLYIPCEYALHVYDSLMTAGKNYGIRNAGYYALRALRTEKFFAYWGTDLTPYSTPMECGREYRVKFDAGNFIGHAALLKQKEEGIRQKLVQFLLEEHNTDKDLWPWGGEPIYRNGKFVGLISSTAYGFTLDRQVCLGYVADYDEATGSKNIITNDFILKDSNFEIDIAGKRFPAKAGIYPPKLASAAIVIDTPTKKSSIS